MPVPEQFPVFVYGSLRRGEVFHEVIESYVRMEVPAKLHGMQMYYVGDFPALVFDETAKEPVVGELLYFSQDWWAKAVVDMDKIESEGFLYNRTQVIVMREDGEAATAWVYVLNQKALPLSRLRKVESNNWKLRGVKNANLARTDSSTHTASIARMLSSGFHFSR